MSAAGDRARARIRRNRREIELLALSGAFGPVKTAREETIQEFAAMVGCTVEDVIAGEMAACEARNAADDDDDDDEIVGNPPAGASWVGDARLDRLVERYGREVLRETAAPSVGKQPAHRRYEQFALASI